MPDTAPAAAGGLCLSLNLHAPDGASGQRAYTPGDDFYAELMQLHADLSDEQSLQVNARLILLLANHIGDLRVLRAAMQIAREL